jgi:predicted methyltransferase
VWTPPPAFALKGVARAKCPATGESDRMALKFVKA